MASIQTHSAAPLAHSVDPVNTSLDLAVGPIVFIVFGILALSVFIYASTIVWDTLCSISFEEGEKSICVYCEELSSKLRADGYIASGLSHFPVVPTAPSENDSTYLLSLVSSKTSWFDCSSVHCSRLSAATPLLEDGSAAHYGTMYP